MSKVHPGFEARGRIPLDAELCDATQYGDMMYCHTCGVSQDTNDPRPRSCPRTGRDMRIGGGPEWRDPKLRGVFHYQDPKALHLRPDEVAAILTSGKVSK